MSFFDSLRSGLSAMASPFRSVVSSLAPVAGTLLGGYFGGPGGAGIGSGLGSAIGRWIGGGGEQQQPHQAVEGAVNHMMPEGMQGMTFGQMGNQLQGQAGNFLNSAIGRYAPQLGGLGIGSAAANAAGDWLRNRFGGSLGMTPGQAAGSAMNYGMNKMMPSASPQSAPMALPNYSGMGNAVNGRPMGANTYNEGGYVNYPGNMSTGGAY